MNDKLQRKVERAINLIKAAAEMATEHGQPLEVCYSGGKDSDVILELTKMAGVNYRAIYKNTTIDPPGTIKHAKDNGVEVRQPQMTFMQVLESAGLVSRFRRACCEKLKEYKILDFAVIGIRRDESAKRAERYKEPELCRVYKKNEKARLYLPILEWTAEDVEAFIKQRGIKCHPLYYDAEGNFHVERRLGCIGCPLASKKKRIEDFKKYPKMARFYIRGGQNFLDNHKDSKIHAYFKNAYEWFAFTLTCDSLEEFRMKFGDSNIFGEGVDCKEYLEEILHTTL